MFVAEEKAGQGADEEAGGQAGAPGALGADGEEEGREEFGGNRNVAVTDAGAVDVVEGKALGGPAGETGLDTAAEPIAGEDGSREGEEAG